MSHLRNRNIALVVCGAGAIVWAAALLQPGLGAAASEAHKTALALGSICTVAGLVAALLFAIPAAGEARVRSGRGVIARWHVDAGRWAGFATYDRGLAAGPAVPAQRVRVTRRALATGADVVVGEAGLLVGNDYWTLDNGYMVAAGMRVGPPLCIEFQFNVVGGEGADVAYRLTVPVAPDSDANAAAVIEAHDRLMRERAATSRPGSVFREPRRWRRMSAWVLAACAAAVAYAGAAIALHDAGPLEGLLLGGGLLLGMGAAVIFLASHLAAKRERA